jgi:cation:H+ antiporter
LVVGLTVVAYGTSAPEIVVGVSAALDGHGQVALGNVVGSNLANIGLVLGITAIVRAPRVHATLRRRELPVFLGSAALVPLLLMDGVIRRWEGLLLMVLAMGYTMAMVHSVRTKRGVKAARLDVETTAKAASDAGAAEPIGRSRAVISLVIGLGALLAGGHAFVHGAVSLARAIGVSERLIGLTLVAIGTSLPELVTSVLAAHRGHSDLAVGNVVGSNIFNVLLCLGAAAVVHPIETSVFATRVEVGAMLFMTGLAWWWLRSARTLSRLHGTLLLLVYIACTFALFVTT